MQQRSTMTQIKPEMTLEMPLAPRLELEMREILCCCG